MTMESFAPILVSLKDVKYVHVLVSNIADAKEIPWRIPVERQIGDGCIIGVFSSEEAALSAGSRLNIRTQYISVPLNVVWS